MRAGLVPDPRKNTGGYGKWPIIVPIDSPVYSLAASCSPESVMSEITPLVPGARTFPSGAPLRADPQ